MANKGDGIVRRIDRGLYNTIRQISIKNNTSIVQASKDADAILKQLNGRKLSREVKF